MIDRKSQTVDIYERVATIVWQRFSPTFGIRTINAIAKNVLARRVRDHPFVRYLQVDENGLVWSGVRGHLDEVSDEELAASLESFMEGFFDALSDLIGALVVGRLFQEVEELVERGGSV